MSDSLCYMIEKKFRHWNGKRLRAKGLGDGNIPIGEPLAKPMVMCLLEEYAMEKLVLAFGKNEPSEDSALLSDNFFHFWRW